MRDKSSTGGCMSDVHESVVHSGGTSVTVLTAGTGRPLLMLHDELGYPGWMTWNEELAADHRFVIPLQPGFGRSPRADWMSDYRDLAAFYNQLVRELALVLHDLTFILFVVAIVFHIYLGTAAEPGTFHSMIRGSVSKRWARFHHPRWYREVMGEESRHP